MEYKNNVLNHDNVIDENFYLEDFLESNSVTPPLLSDEKIFLNSFKSEPEHLLDFEENTQILLLKQFNNTSIEEIGFECSLKDSESLTLDQDYFLQPCKNDVNVNPVNCRSETLGLDVFEESNHSLFDRISNVGPINLQQLKKEPEDPAHKLLINNKVYKCNVCERDFLHKYTLMRHGQTHTNQRNYECTECGKTFRQLSTLSQHQIIHSVDRPYSCEVCKKSFNRVSTLISHRKTHSNFKPFVCHLCNKAFHQKGNLQNHIYIHTNERPYLCQYCNKGFNQMSNLVCHKRKSHSSEMIAVWECHRCNISFPKRNLLRIHEFETHNVKETITSSKKKYVSKNDLENVMDEHPNSEIINGIKPNLSHSVVQQTPAICKGIFLPAINTDAMKAVKAKKEIPFAVLHFLEAMPCLVRIIDYGTEQSLLRPANQDDFLALRKDSKETVPIVASVYQIKTADNNTIFSVVPPKNIYKFAPINPEQEQQLQYNISPILQPPQIKYEPPSTDYKNPLKLSPNNEMQENCSNYCVPSTTNFTVINKKEKNNLFNINPEQEHLNDVEGTGEISKSIQNFSTGKLLSPNRITIVSNNHLYYFFNMI